MVKRLVCLAFAGAVWISGCAGLKASGASDGFLETDLRTSNRPVAKDSEWVYLILAAELAGQRGQYEDALDNYLQVARHSNDPRIAERATQIALYLKNADKAMEAAQLWAKLDPNNVAAHRVATLMLLKAGRTKQAAEEFGKVLKLRNGDLEGALIDLVKWLDTEVSKEDGLKAMQFFVEQFPKVAELHFAYALLATNKGEQQLALKETERALALHPDWNRARLLQAQVMSQMGDSEAARGAVQKALKRDPGNTRLRLIYSQFLAKTGDYPAAERELQRILEKDPGNQDARFVLASTWLEMGRLDQAAQEFNRLTGVAKWESQAYFSLGLIEARRGRLGRALQWFDKVASGPLEFDARVNGITALINLGRLDEARQRLSVVRKRFPNEAVRLYLLEAELLSKNKDYEAAFELLSEALEELPDQVELLYSRALVAEQLDRIDVLEADLRAVLDKNPNDPNALNALGYTLADRTDRLDEAQKYLDQAIGLKPDDPAIMDSYGWLQYRLGNLEKALSYLRKAYEKVPDPEIGAHFGEVLWESGERKEAKRVWNESWKKDPDQDDIKKVRARYREAFK